LVWPWIKKLIIWEVYSSYCTEIKFFIDVGSAGNAGEVTLKEVYLDKYYDSMALREQFQVAEVSKTDFEKPVQREKRQRAETAQQFNDKHKDRCIVRTPPLKRHR
jgi:hypothetical protein